MTSHDVWRALLSGAPSTVAELAGRLNADPEAVRKRISHLQRCGRVVSDGRKGARGRPRVYRATGRPQAHAAGLTDALLKILSNHGDVGRFIAASGLHDGAVERTLSEALLDEPDGWRQLSRSVAAEAAGRLASQLERQAKQLREWAQRCDAAASG